MRLSLRSLVLLVLLALGAAPAARAQAPAEPSAVSAAVPAAQAGGLPERVAPPRTLRDYGHVFLAFALAWLLLFGYVVSLGRRFARLEEELQRQG